MSTIEELRDEWQKHTKHLSTTDTKAIANIAGIWFIYKFTTLQQNQMNELIEQVEKILPDIGIMAATNISREAVMYVYGFDKAKEEIINLLKK